MKFKNCLGIFLIVLIIIVTNCSEIKKPKSNRLNKEMNDEGPNEPMSYFKNSKPHFNAFSNALDLDVLIRFRFAKYNTNILANFISGILSSLYNRQFLFLRKQENSNEVLNNHIHCIIKNLGPLFNNNQIVRVFENKFLYGGIYPFKKTIKNQSIFTLRYNFLRRRNKILGMVRRLKRVTGTFQANERFWRRKKKLNALYKKYKHGVPRKILKKLKPRKKNTKYVQKLKTIKSYRRYKTALFVKKMKKWKTNFDYENHAKKIIGKNAKQIIAHAKFMTYAYRKIWFYTSYFTKRILTCGITSSYSSTTIRKLFLHYYRRNQRIACPYKYIDVLALMFEKYSVRNSFRILFKDLLINGVKKKLIHKLKWYRIGQAVFSAHQVLEKLCPWF